MSKIIYRLFWLAILFAAVAAIGIAGILALVLVGDRTRIGLVMTGGLIAVIFVTLIYIGQLRGHLRPIPKPTDTYEAELSAGQSGWFARPANPVPRTPTLMWRPLETSVPDAAVPDAAAPDAVSDTRPIHPVQIQEPPRDPISDTKPVPAVKPAPVYAAPMPGHGPYDDLFPPPQPGDEDYLEYQAAAATQSSARPTTPSVPRDEQPTVPVSGAGNIQPSARSGQPDPADRTVDSGEPEHLEQADSDSPVPPDNLPA